MDFIYLELQLNNVGFAQEMLLLVLLTLSLIPVLVDIHLIKVNVLFAQLMLQLVLLIVKQPPV